jgi:uncharacterized protein (DUF1778 family)
MSISTQKRSERIEVRVTAEELKLIDQAASLSGVDTTAFVLSNLLDTSRRILADRDVFAMSPEAVHEWERINALPARELRGLQALFERPPVSVINRGGHHG